MNRTTSVAAAVAAVLSSTAALAAPTLTDIQGTDRAHTIYVSGSSAIKAALTNTILANFCGGAANATKVVPAAGSNGNFLGIACTPAANKASDTTKNYNVWIRYEGGSVSGYLPMVNTSSPIDFIDAASLTSTSPTIGGTSANNGINDSFTGPLSRHIPDLGIGDVEAKALIGNNYPAAYNPAVWGPSNPAGLFGLKTQPLIDEVYALYVNENSAVFTETPLNLSQQTITAILNHSIKNWSAVYDVNNQPVTNGSLLISIVDREAGSGSRAATDILLAGDTCGGGSGAALFDKAGATGDFFSTGDVLNNANGIPGAITYATIDNTPGVSTGSTLTSNLHWVSINGVAPSNLAAASGTYPFWVESQYFDNHVATTGDATAIASIVGALQDGGSTASLADVLVIPGLTAGNVPHLTIANAAVTASGGGTNLDGSSSTVYVNAYTRTNVTCNFPALQAAVN